MKKPAVIWLLALIASILVGHHFLSVPEKKILLTENTHTPEYQMYQGKTTIYDVNGKLLYNLTSDNIRYYQDNNISWFTNPVLIIFDNNIVADWSVQAELAKINSTNQLFLSGNVILQKLHPNSAPEKIVTNSAQIDLITQNVSSDAPVTIYGKNFISHGLKMRGNIHNKSIRLIEGVKTRYENTDPK